MGGFLLWCLAGWLVAWWVCVCWKSASEPASSGGKDEVQKRHGRREVLFVAGCFPFCLVRRVCDPVPVAFADCIELEGLIE